MSNPVNEWNAVISADLKDAEYTGGTPIPDGSYAGHVSNLCAKTFKSGAKGVEAEYTLTVNGETRTIKEYFIIKKIDGTINKLGPASLKKLMMECGLTPESVLKFNFPAFDSNSFGDFKKLLDEPLTVEVRAQVDKKGLHIGKSFARVKSFSQRKAA